MSYLINYGRLKSQSQHIAFTFICSFVQNIKIRFSIGPLLYTLKGERLQKDTKNATLAYFSLKQHQANELNGMLH